MTVNKAYTALKNEGYIEIDRRHGARVSPAVRLDGEFRDVYKRQVFEMGIGTIPSRIKPSPFCQGGFGKNDGAGICFLSLIHI